MRDNPWPEDTVNGVPSWEALQQDMEHEAGPSYARYCERLATTTFVYAFAEAMPKGIWKALATLLKGSPCLQVSARAWPVTSLGGCNPNVPSATPRQGCVFVCSDVYWSNGLKKDVEDGEFGDMLLVQQFPVASEGAWGLQGMVV